MIIFFSCVNEQDKIISHDEYIIYSLILDSLYYSVKDDTLKETLVIKEKFDFKNLIKDQKKYFRTDTVKAVHNVFLISDSTYFLDLPTSEFDFSQRAKSSFPGLSDETINNFILFNKNKHIINDTLFTSNSNYSVELKNNIVWNEIYNKYPDRIGVVFFSKVGFNNDKTQAFVDIGFLKAKKSGYGFQVLFKKKDSKWAVLMWLNKWTS